MGGRGASSGFGGKSKKEKSFNRRFKRYDYNGRIIYKINNQYAIFGKKEDDIVRIDKTLKESKTAIDRWNEALKRRKSKK